jgi:hypothetical protein
MSAKDLSAVAPFEAFEYIVRNNLTRTTPFHRMHLDKAGICQEHIQPFTEKVHPAQRSKKKMGGQFDDAEEEPSVPLVPSNAIEESPENIAARTLAALSTASIWNEETNKDLIAIPLVQTAVSNPAHTCFRCSSLTQMLSF